MLIRIAVEIKMNILIGFVGYLLTYLFWTKDGDPAMAQTWGLDNIAWSLFFALIAMAFHYKFWIPLIVGFAGGYFLVRR